MIKKVLSFQRCLPNFHQTNVRYIKKQIPLFLKKKKRKIKRVRWKIKIKDNP